MYVGFLNYVLRILGVSDSTVGPAVLEIINNLLKHLERSVALGRKYEEPGSRAMQCYQAALLRAMVCCFSTVPCSGIHLTTLLISCLLRFQGEYTSKMPDFQKTENMTFILSKIPMDKQQKSSANTSNVDTDVQHIFMKALFSVAEKHTSTLFSSTFSTGKLYIVFYL